MLKPFKIATEENAAEEEELNTPTDNEQLLRLKRMSKSPHSKPRLGDLAL